MSSRILERTKKHLDLETETSEGTKAPARSSKEVNGKKPKAKAPHKGLAFRKNLFEDSLNSDLKNALDSWENLAEEVGDKVAPDQEQLQEVKKLLGELKSQLDVFIKTEE